jgi:hypothetical protein
VHGKFVTCGMPDHPLLGLASMALLKKDAFFSGSTARRCSLCPSSPPTRACACGSPSSR